MSGLPSPLFTSFFFFNQAINTTTDTAVSHTFFQFGTGSQNVIDRGVRDDLSMAEVLQRAKQTVHAGDRGEAYAQVIAVASLLHCLHDPGEKQMNSANQSLRGMEIWVTAHSTGMDQIKDLPP